MSKDESQDLAGYCLDVAQRAKAAAAQLAVATGEAKNAWLCQSARLLRKRTSLLAEANQQDLDAAPGFGLTGAQTDRLKLTPKRIEEIAVGLEAVAALPDPVGEILSQRAPLKMAPCCTHAAVLGSIGLQSIRIEISPLLMRNHVLKRRSHI